MIEKLITQITDGEDIDNLKFPYHIGNNYFNMKEDSEGIIRHVSVSASELPEAITDIFEIPSLFSISLKGRLPRKFNINFDCSFISSLKLTETELNNERLGFLKQFTGLEFLDLSINRLKLVPKELKNLQNLKVLNLSHNYIQHFDSSSLEDIPLEELYMAYCKLSDFVLPDNFARSIRVLDLDHNKLQSIVIENPNLINLIFLNLSNNNLKLFNPDIFTPELKFFDISNTPINSIPAFLKELEKLETLNLERTRIEQHINVKNDLNAVSSYLRESSS